MLSENEKWEKKKIRFNVTIEDYTLKDCIFSIKEKHNNKKFLIKGKNKQRKYKPDDIRKKIKTRFHKAIKNIINENLRKAGSNQFFDFLPQTFISNISRETNQKIMNLTYKELLEKDFLSESKIDSHQFNVDKLKYEKNLKVLKYLEENPIISFNSGFHLMCKLSYAEILNIYFNSDEFEKSIKKLKEEKENDEYIKEYKLKAKTYVKFFSNRKEINNNYVIDLNEG